MREFNLKKDFAKNVFNDAMMKKYLPKNEIKMLKGLYGRAYGTYLSAAASIIGLVWATDKVKNLIDKSKKVEMQTKNEFED